MSDAPATQPEHERVPEPVATKAPPSVLERAGSRWRVVLPVFEGPLELLLTLIRREALDLSTVSLAMVTDQYLKHLATLQAVDVPELADFCETAATLVSIKSRWLLPRPPGDELDEDADAAELLERLREYRRYRRVAEGLAEREREGLRAFPRAAAPPPAPSGPAPRPDDEATADDLAAAFRRALAEAAKQTNEPTGPPVRAHRVHLRERFTTIREILLRQGSASFEEIVLSGRPADAEPREFVIVSFLALLEMLRRWAVRVTQDDLFGNIRIEARSALATVAVPGEGGAFTGEEWDDET